jgi:hypothetical protein
MKEKDMDYRKRFISKDYGCLKINEWLVKGGVFISQGKFSLYGNDKNKYRNME